MHKCIFVQRSMNQRQLCCLIVCKTLFPVTVFFLNCGIWARGSSMSVHSFKDCPWSTQYFYTGCSQGCSTNTEWERWGYHSPSSGNSGSFEKSMHSTPPPPLYSTICISSDQLFSGVSFSYLLCICQNLKDDATAALEQQQEAEAEAKSLRTMTQRMILTQEEMVCVYHWNKI